MTKGGTLVRAAPKKQPRSKSNASQKTILQKLDKLSLMIPRGTFQKVGAAVGGTFGGPKGAFAGALAGRGIAAITGRGDYVVERNTLGTMSVSVDELPQFVKNKHSVIISHREYFADLVVPADPTLYHNTTYTLNPGNGTLFPWLALMAKQYQQYKIRGMVVEFKSNTSDYAASGPLGVVGIASNYNVNEVKYPNLVAFENSEYAVVSKPSRSMIHAIECKPRTGRDEFMYVRDPGSIDPAAVSDNRFCDYALLQVMTSGLPGTAGALLGQLFVSYEIEFTKPIISPSAVVPPPATVDSMVLSSLPNGTVGLGVSADIQTITYTCPSLGPAVSTVYTFVVPSTGVASGDTGLDGTLIVSKNATQLTLTKPGVYNFIYTMTGNTATANEVLGANNVASTSGSVAYNGSATGSNFVFLNGYQAAHQVRTGTVTNGYQYTCFAQLQVTTADATNNVTVTVPSFTSHNGSLIGGVVRALTIQWLNTQLRQVLL